MAVTYPGILLMRVTAGMFVAGAAAAATVSSSTFGWRDLLRGPTAVVPGFPVWDLAGLLGSAGWGLWVAALGVTLLLRPIVGATLIGTMPTATRPSSVASLRSGAP